MEIGGVAGVARQVELRRHGLAFLDSREGALAEGLAASQGNALQLATDDRAQLRRRERAERRSDRPGNRAGRRARLRHGTKHQSERRSRRTEQGLL